jgi:hypothetical protein
MAGDSTTNTLYLAVIPTISLGSGATEQLLTMLPDRDFATEFFSDEVDNYIAMFMRRTKYFTGGHVIGYDCHKQATPSGRFVVRVTQNVK